MASEAQKADAAVIVRRLTGQRWVWPPMRVTEVYPVGPNGMVRLVGRPVRVITSVTDPDSDDVVEFTRPRTGWIRVNRADCWPGRRIEVAYEYGSEPPITIQNAIKALAEEFNLAAEDDPKCKLPSRVTSVNRQGVSWTLIDPMDYLDKGRTGIAEIDQVLSIYGTPKRRAQVFTQEYPPPDRLSIEQLADPNVVTP